ncbi:MAG: Daunorubicin/doxorubicin resistance ABC transporter permease protein DrrB [Bacteroidetes bacterium ADurb.Bin145]|nr:MAG: Daunorubicin/doxorubicin resistance ABC transporter permease protein DrrB [Bacteroidetes bacterium ADurb.Bin145]
MNAIIIYCLRDLVRWIRGKWGFISSLIAPAAWLIFVGMALPIKFTDNYLAFITPGILVMTILSASMQGGALLIMDKILGFYNKFMALPPPRESILFGKILVITIRGIIQSSIILGLAFLLGVPVYSPVQIIAVYLILILFGGLLSSVTTTIAVLIGEHDSYAAVTAMITMPLFFASSAMMPYSSMPGWLVIPASLNPLSIAIDSIRAVSEGMFPGARLFILVIITVVMISVNVKLFRNVKL